MLSLETQTTGIPRTYRNGVTTSTIPVLEREPHRFESNIFPPWYPTMGTRRLDRPSMQEYEFTCPECGQQIAINDPMRDAILTNGCPVCSASVARENIVPS